MSENLPKLFTTQFSTVLAAQASDVEGRFSALHAWIIENIASDLRVEKLAANEPEALHVIQVDEIEPARRGLGKERLERPSVRADVGVRRINESRIGLFDERRKEQAYTAERVQPHQGTYSLEPLLIATKFFQQFLTAATRTFG